MHRHPSLRLVLPIAAVCTALALPPLAPAPARAAARPTAPTTVTVFGEGRASANPDVVYLFATISTTEPTASKALDDNAARYAGVLKRLGRIGVPASAVQTTGFSMTYQPPPTPEPGAMRPVPQPGSYGFTVRRSLRITANDIHAAGAVIDAAVAGGATEIGNVLFSIRDAHALQQSALRNAVADAHLEATTLAAAAGMHLGPLLSLQTGFVGLPQAPMPGPYLATATARAFPTEITPSELTANASVTATYRLLP